MASPHDLEFGQEMLKKAVKEALCFHGPLCMGSTHLLDQRLSTLKAGWTLLGALRENRIPVLILVCRPLRSTVLWLGVADRPFYDDLKYVKISHSKDSGLCLQGEGRRRGPACRMAVMGWTGRGISYRGGLCNSELSSRRKSEYWSPHTTSALVCGL